MSPRHMPQAAQLGFNSLLDEAETANTTHKLAKELAHLPGSFDEALPFYRALIERHHAAMLAGFEGEAMELREEADRLATKLNNFDPGILAHNDAPGYVLTRGTRAEHGTVPLWGQTGSFEITHGGMRVQIEMEGIFGVASNVFPWLGFAAHAIEWDKPFLSETGYRSFIGLRGGLHPGMTPDSFAREIIALHVSRDLKKSQLVAIKPEYRERHEAVP
ncbi:MAG: hypothetical protein QOJ84_3772 [Bradyrhizobium sp.]|jgi:hypothetical protein|nr:hypothetical protein [Bradyrhizobium sp.]